MNKIKWVLVIIAVCIDFFGTTIAQTVVSYISTDFWVLLTVGGLVSLIAGYFLVYKLNGVKDQNLLALCFLNTVIGFTVLQYNEVATRENLMLLLLTPLLNFIGGYIASIRK